MFSIFFVVGNWPALKSKLDYALKPPKISSSLLNITQKNAFIAQKNSPSGPSISDNTLYIPLLNVKVPIKYSDGMDLSEIEGLLKEGVVQIGGTAAIGTLGNAAITGHSSSYMWDKSQKYGQAFALLDKLNSDDLIWIRSNNKMFAYNVKSKFIVKPADVSILNSGKEAILTLFTCYPVGTTRNRLVVQASLLYPDKPLPPIGNQITTQELPKVR